jgi:hypothetical protein
MLTPTKGLPARALAAWMPCASSSLPVPVSHGAVGLRHAPRLALDLHCRRAAADETGDAVLGPALRGQLLARAVQFALQPRELGHQRLHRRLGLVQQHHAEGADHLAGLVAQRQPADQEGARLVAEQVHQDRLAGVDDLVHQRVRHHLLDALADEVFGAVEAQRRQELLVTLADPDDAVLAVDQHRAHGRTGEHVEHALCRQLEHLVVGQLVHRGGAGCMLVPDCRWPSRNCPGFIQTSAAGHIQVPIAIM